MRRRALIASCAVLCLLLLMVPVGAQNAPEAPRITAAGAAVNVLTVAWAAPVNDGGAAISAYDLRYIRNDATDKADDHWTVEDDVWRSGDGALRYELKDLFDGTQYDLQVRAVNANGDGLWSATYEATTRDHSGSRSGATILSPGSSAPGRIDPSGDQDFFRIVLADAADLWLYTSGRDDTVGELLRADGTVLAANDDGVLLDGPRNFSIRRELPAGTYYATVGSFGALDTASYTLHARLAADPGDTKDRATAVTPGSFAPGRIGPEGGVDGDKDYFKIELTSAAEIWVMAVGPVDTVGELLDADENVLAENDDSEFVDNEKGFMIRRQLATGTYYVRVSGYNADDTGPYTLFARVATEPGNSTATAGPITLHIPESGRIASSSDQDYFRLTLEEETYVFVYALAFGYVRLIGDDRVFVDPLPLRATVFDAQNTELADLYVIPHAIWADHGLPEVSFSVWGKLAAGTYHIRIAPPPGGTGGTYLLHSLVSGAYARTIERCTGLTTPQSDPLYGCQWHLNNTRQFPGGAGRDINVEEVWATTMGAGVNVAVVDDGLQYGHEDLTANVERTRNHDYYGSDLFDPLETHGTRVAGIIAARDNDLGLRGVAPRATIYGYNLIDDNNFSALDAANSVSRHAGDTAVFNNSWGTPDTGARLGFAYESWERGVRTGVEQGFGGKGALYVFSAGNGHEEGDNANLDEYGNHYGVTAVCAVNHNDVRSAYSEVGANLWICAPSGDGSLGLPGIATTRNGSRYTTAFSGTSAAAPIVSGVAALVRATNPDLTWRDVKLILAASARRNDRSNSGWLSGARKYNNARGERYAFNHAYGFGVVDAGAAVALAEGWTTVPALREIEGESGDLDLALPDARSLGSGTTVTTSVAMDSYVGFIEFVEINATFDHPSFRDLQLDLVSPSGARSRLTHAVYRTRVGSDGTVTQAVTPLTAPFRFGSARHLGENAAGTWRLEIIDLIPENAGTLQSWSLTIYGHGLTPGAPRVDPATPVNEALAVEWTAPDDAGGSAITAYDVRSIRGDAADKSDASWRVVRNAWLPARGDRRYVIRNLENDTEYDVQVRAVNSAGRGRWSATAPGKPELGNSAAEFPMVESGDRSVDENTPAGRDIGAAVAARDDDNDPLTYALSGSAAAFFDLVEGTGQLRTKEPLDHENRDSYAGIMTVTDGKNADGDADSAIDARIPITIAVGDVDEAPEVSGQSSVDIREGGNRRVGFYNATDPENSPVGLSLAGADRDDFAFRNGLLEFRATPDYESPTDANRDNVYQVVVEGSDGALKGTLDVTVTVENVDEPGTLLPSSRQPQAGTRLTTTLTDPDGRITGLAWAWESSPNRFNWSPIDGATAATYTPTTSDADERRYLRVTAAYGDGEGSGKSASWTADDRVQAAPVTMNHAPEFPSSESGQRSVIENTGAGVSIGAPVRADDADNDPLTYSLDRSGATVFAIDERTGQLRTKAALDREQRSSYRVTVTATDPSLASDSIAVTITLDDIDEDPELSGASVVSFAEGGSGSVARYSATRSGARHHHLVAGGSRQQPVQHRQRRARFLTRPTTRRRRMPGATTSTRSR